MCLASKEDVLHAFLKCEDTKDTRYKNLVIVVHV